MAITFNGIFPQHRIAIGVAYDHHIDYEGTHTDEHIEPVNGFVFYRHYDILEKPSKVQTWAAAKNSGWFGGLIVSAPDDGSGNNDSMDNFEFVRFGDNVPIEVDYKITTTIGSSTPTVVTGSVFFPVNTSRVSAPFTLSVPIPAIGAGTNYQALDITMKIPG